MRKAVKRICFVDAHSIEKANSFEHPPNRIEFDSFQAETLIISISRRRSLFGFFVDTEIAACTGIGNISTFSRAPFAFKDSVIR